MENKINKLEIIGLHGNRNLTIPIENNQLILVGENGTGKSTVAYIFYYILTKQWERLADYSFKEFSLYINDEKITIFPDDIKNSSVTSLRNDKLSSLSFEFLSQRNASFEEVLSNDYLFNELRSYLGHLYYGRIPSREYLYDKILALSSCDRSSPNENLKKIESSIDDHFNCAVLFLPTFRRIEQDIKVIYPRLANELKRYNEDFDMHATDKKHVELVKFGMQDVVSMIKTTMIHFKEDFRKSLEDLMGTYLKDILQQKHRAIDIEIEKISEKLDITFQRIDENILSKEDKKVLRRTINEIVSGKDVSGDDYVIAHFLSKLIKINEDQSEKEKSVRDFIQVCNNYMRDRLQIEYDNVKFTVEVKTKYKLLGENVYQKIEFDDLSSGEKQIVSLFCHLYLSSQEEYYVIIDEPELSLSVPWQKKILPDIIGSGKCGGLLAVTHSPFVFDNCLEPYTHSIEEFVKE